MTKLWSGLAIDTLAALCGEKSSITLLLLDILSLYYHGFDIQQVYEAGLLSSSQSHSSGEDNPSSPSSPSKRKNKVDSPDKYATRVQKEVGAVSAIQ